VNGTRCTLEREAYAFGVEAADRREAARRGVAPLEAEGAAEFRYRDAIVPMTEELEPWCVLAPGVAMPHAVPNRSAARSATPPTRPRPPASSRPRSRRCGGEAMSTPTVRFGLYEKAFPASLDWPQRLAATRELGYEFMEMSIDEADARLARLDWTRDERRAFRFAVEDCGVAVPSICLSAHRRFPFGSADPGVRARAREIMAKSIDLSVALGVRTVQLAGYDVYYEPSTPDTLARFAKDSPGPPTSRARPR